MEDKENELNDSKGVMQFKGEGSEDALDSNNNQPFNNKIDKSGKSDIEIVQEE